FHSAEGRADRNGGSSRIRPSGSAAGRAPTRRAARKPLVRTRATRRSPRARRGARPCVSTRVEPIGRCAAVVCRAGRSRTSARSGRSDVAGHTRSGRRRIERVHYPRQPDGDFTGGALAAAPRRHRGSGTTWISPRVGVVPAGWRQSRWHSGRRWGTAHQRLQGDQVLEYAVAELLEEGEIQRHIRRVRREYATRRDVLVKALREHLAERITFEVPAGGIALWVRAIGVDVDVWARSAPEKGAIVVTAAEMGPPISVLLTAPRVLTLARRHPAVRPAQQTSIDRPASARNSLQRTATGSRADQEQAR